MAAFFLNNIATFIKFNRTKLRLTQEKLAEKAGVGLRFIRDLEQGKESLRLDKVNQVLALFGHHVIPGSEKIMDPYAILLNHMNRDVRITLKDRTTRVGRIVGQVIQNNEAKSWRFLSGNNSIDRNKTGDEAIEEKIDHTNIDEIVNL